MSEPLVLTRSGYTFAGWSETQGGAAVTFPYVPEIDTITTLYSRWNAAEVSAPGPNPSSTSSSGSATSPTFSISARPKVSANGQSLTLRGDNLGNVTRVRVGGKDAKISKKADGELVIEVPAGTEGFPDVEITHSGGTVSMQGLIQVVAPYVAVRTVKITQFVGNRPTRAGLAKLEQAYLAGTTANQLTCVATVASDASASAIIAATKRAKATCASVVRYSKYLKSADVHLSKDGARGSKPVLAVTFDKAMGKL